MDDVPEQCPHSNTEFVTDKSCGGWYEICRECNEIIKSGMMGHN